MMIVTSSRAWSIEISLSIETESLKQSLHSLGSLDRANTQSTDDTDRHQVSVTIDVTRDSSGENEFLRASCFNDGNECMAIKISID